MILRYDIINKIISNNNFSSYLEIGVCDPNDCFNKINCEIKDSVDPGVEFSQNPVKYQYTSDEFFTKLENGDLDKDPDFKWDVIFIDGLHISEQVLKDVMNSLEHLKPNGYILLHDCNPPEIFYAREDYYINGQQHPWNGTVWKAVYYLRCWTDLDVCTVDTDWGVSIIRSSKGMNRRPIVKFNNMFYEYNKMSQNRTEDLGLITTDRLESWLNNEFKI